MNKNGLRSFFIMLLVWCVVIASASPLSRAQWTRSTGVTRFGIGWIDIATFAACSMTTLLIWLKTKKIGIKAWLWFFAPYLASIILLVLIGDTLRETAKSSTGDGLIRYAICSSGYVAEILLWIVGFPYENIWGPRTQRGRFAWKIAMSVVGLGLAGLSFVRSVQLARSFVTSTGFLGIQVLQLWMQRVTVAVFLFLTARLFLPVTVSLAVAAFGGPNSPDKTIRISSAQDFSGR